MKEKCIHCKQIKGKHQAKSFACPILKSRYSTYFSRDTVFTPKPKEGK